jgi:hypothetical protein
MCCGRRAATSGRTTGTDSGGASTGGPSGMWTVTRPDGTTTTKTSEIAAKLFVAANPGSSYRAA